jgi:hypothetical protein
VLVLLGLVYTQEVNQKENNMANGFAKPTTTGEDIANALAEMGSPFKSESRALGSSKKVVGEVVKKEVSTPLKDLSNFFAGIDKSLINLVKFAKESLGLQEKEIKRKDKKFMGPMPSNRMKIRTGRDTLIDTDDEVDPEKSKSSLKDVLATLKESFDKVSFGEVLTATLFAGGLALFLNYREAIEKALLPFVKLIKGVVDLIGVKGTLMTLFGILLGIKLFPVISAATGVVTYLGKKFLPSFKTLKTAFKDMNNFIRKKLIPGLRKSYKKGSIGKALKMLKTAFTSLRFLLTASLYPAIISMVTTLAAALGPILGPVLIIGAIAAGIAAVLFSIKSGFETFKNSLAEGDSMLLAIGKGISDFALTLYTLPLTLIKKIIGYIAGLFGFDGIKEALDKFSFKDFIKKSFIGFVTSFVKVIKAIAKGAAAALAAIAPGGKTPQGEFSRVYNEVMQGGQGEVKVEKSDLEKTNTQGQPELTENEVADKIDKGEITGIKKPSGLPDTPGLLGFKFDEPFLKIKSREERKLEKEIKIQKEIEKDNLAASKKLNPEAMYTEITDNSSKIISKTEVNEAPLEVNNTEAFNRLINGLGGRYGNTV